MTKYFYLENNTSRGPFSLEEVKYLIDRGTLSPDQLIRDEESENWSKASTFRIINENISSPTTAAEDNFTNKNRHDKSLLDTATASSVKKQPNFKQDHSQSSSNTFPASPPPLPKRSRKVNPFFVVFVTLLILLLLIVILMPGKGSNLSGPVGGNANSGDNGKSRSIEENGKNDSTGGINHSLSDKVDQKQNQGEAITQKEESTPSLKKELADNNKETDISKNISQKLEENPNLKGNEENDSATSGEANINNFLPESSFFGINAEGKNVVYVVDCSNSMRDNNKFSDVKKETIRSIESLSDNQYFTVIFFSDKFYPMPMPDGSQFDLLKANDKNKSTMTKWVNNFNASGGTYPLEAILQAINLKPNAIYFLTDGGFHPNVPGIINRNNINDIPVHCICFKDLSGEYLMKQIAKESGGTFRYVP